MTDQPQAALGPGQTVCHYTATVAYAGKEKFCVYQPSMTVVRRPTGAETEAAASKEAERQVADFWSRHMPDGAARPAVVSVRLGSTTFVPDDYEWRRG